MFSSQSQAEIFTHFLPHDLQEVQTKIFQKTVLPLLNSSWHQHTDEIIAAIKNSKEKIESNRYREYVLSIQRYINSRDFAMPGRYEIKTSWFFSGIQYFGETAAFSKLNQKLDALLAEVPVQETSYWNTITDFVSSSISFVTENPVKAFCSLLALEAAAVTAISMTQPRSDNSATTSIVDEQIPDQLINVGDVFDLKFDMKELFGESVGNIMLSTIDGSALPGWLTVTTLPIMRGNISISYAREVAISGKYAYLSAGRNGLKIIDVSNETSPVLCGSIDMEYALGVAIKGNYAYVANALGGLEIIDISNASSPVLQGSIATKNALGVAINGNYAYVADSDGGLKIIDVSNATNPVLQGSFATKNALGVAINENYAYVADSDGGLKIIDVSNATNPVLQGSFAVLSITGVAFRGSYAYVTDAVGGLEIIDVNNVASPVLRGRVASARAEKVAISGNYAYVADSYDGLNIIDVTDATTPRLLSSLACKAKGIAVNVGCAYVVSDNELKIIDLNSWEIYASPNRSKQVYHVLINAQNSLRQTVTKRFSISTDYFPIARETIATQSIFSGQPFTFNWNMNSLFQDEDIDDNLCLEIKCNNRAAPLPAFIRFQLLPRFRYSSTNPAYKIAISRNYAYVLANIDPIRDRTGLEIIDINDPIRPVLLGSIATGGSGGVAVSGNYAYLAGGSAGLKIIDVSNATNPVLCGSIATSNAYGVAISGNYAYLAGGSAGLKIIDVSNATNPVLCGSINSGGEEIAINGNYIYLSDSKYGLKIIDASNATSPVLRGSIATSRAYGVAISGNYAYVADESEGLKIIDVSNATNPVVRGSIVIPSARSVAISGNYVYVADYIEGLKIIDVSNVTSPVLRGDIATSSAVYVTIRGNNAYIEPVPFPLFFDNAHDFLPTIFSPQIFFSKI